MFSPKFTITPKLLSLISEIAEIRTLVSRAKILPQREAILRRQAQIKMAHTSTKIEGNPLAEYEVDKVLSGLKITADDQSIKEVKNYEQALQLVEHISAQKTNTDSPNLQPNNLTYLSKKTILNLHKLVLKDLVIEPKRGHWRPADIYIVTYKTDKTQLDYTGPKSKDIPKHIDDLLEWIYTAEQQQLHPVIISGIIHHQFESIHPFVDGNGRVGRLFTLLYLHLKQWDFKHLITLENYYAKDRVSYIKELRKSGKTFQAKQKYNLTEWLEYFTTGFLEEANKVKDQILPIAMVGDHDQIYLDKDELKILDFLATMGQFKSSDVADILSIPKRTAQAKIKELVDKKIIKANGKGPATFYTLTNINN